MEKVNWKELFTSIGISLGAGILATLLTSGSMIQYENMYNPPLAPPAWVFPVVWTILYVFMGIAAYLVYTSDAKDVSKALTTYAFQLGANVVWTLIFFGLNAYSLAFLWIILLGYLIVLTIKEFSKVDIAAARLLIPYLAWVIFAAYLNFAIAIYY